MIDWTKETPPEHGGPAGRAWKVDLSNYEHKSPDTKATLAVWILNCPGAHPFWHWWLVSAIHLRPMDGVRPAVVRLPGATHEIIVATLNPEYPPPNPNAFQDEAVRLLTPIDVEEQFAIGSDVEAEQLCELAIGACCNGTLSPDQDFRTRWSRHVQATAEHCRAGLHRTDA